MIDKKGDIMPEEKQPTFEEIKAQLTAALQDGNDAEAMRLSKLMVKSKADVEKAEAAKLQAESEALAGERTKLSVEVTKYIHKMPNIVESLGVVKATGFTFKLPYKDANGVMTDASVALAVPTVKTRTGGGGSTGNLKVETGLARHELIEEYGTSDEKVGIKKAGDEATSRPDSARYQAEKPVIKRILADNPQLIKR